jgi:hypothetical protein
MHTFKSSSTAWQKTLAYAEYSVVISVQIYSNRMLSPEHVHHIKTYNGEVLSNIFIYLSPWRR